MTLLSSSWLIIESFIIPQGFIKWFYLSFYIHPFFLFFSQIFLWLKKLERWLLFLFCFLSKITLYLTVFIFKFMKRPFHFHFLFSFNRKSENEHSEIIPKQNCAIVISCSTSPFVKTSETIEEKDINSFTIKESWLNEYLNSDHYYCSLFTSVHNSDTLSECSPSTADSTISSSTEVLEQNIDQDFDFKHEKDEISSSAIDGSQFLEDVLMNSTVDLVNASPFDHIVDDDHNFSFSEAEFNFDEKCLPIFDSSNSPLSVRAMERVDSFHLKYKERLRFFDVLYQERSFGINEILKSPTISVMSREYLWEKMGRENIAKSLKNDIELVNVAGLCLSWEALHYQYREAESLACSTNFQDRIFDASVSKEFQKFQILLERFMEEGKSEDKRCPNYMHMKRFRLQVPDVTGSGEEKGNSGSGGELIRATEVLKAIEKCIKAFWLFVKAEENIYEKKSKWKFKYILWSHPSVEDPRDLELLYYITKTLHKKWILLKDLQGKKKCWLRRRMKRSVWVESEENDVLFSMIDLKLVEKVLKMSLISTSHLKWCQQKLNSLDFKEGKILRNRDSCCLFPCS